MPKMRRSCYHHGMAKRSTSQARHAKKLSHQDADAIVVSQAEDDAALEPAVEVRRGKRGSFSIPPDLAKRAAFLARVHRAPRVDDWLMRLIKERIEIEEVAYAAAKREMKSKPRR